MNPTLARPSALAIALACLLPTLAHAQVRGGNETFTNEDNAKSWVVYEFPTDETPDGAYFIPGWDLFESDNPEAYTFVEPDAGVSIFADDMSSDASFVGDFSGQWIAGMGCDAYVEDASALGSVEMYFVSDGGFYYSRVFSAPDFFATDGWQAISVNFRDEPWYILIEGEFVETPVTESILSTISEVGVNFFSNDTRTDAMFVAIDNFYLLPELILPEVTLARNGTNIDLTFLPEPGQIYDIMEAPDLRTWTLLPGHGDIIGTSPYTASDPLSGKKFFQVLTDPYFTDIPNVEPLP